ncbi:MAG: penicillin acylase family protein [Rhodospirillales bacterium]|nr:penicillin acylase family protein [Rhodospirillales bacterium]
MRVLRPHPPRARRRHVLRRALGWAAGLVGGGALVVLLALAGAIWASLPARRDHLAIPGLSAPVAIAFDDDGVPHIRAANATDAATALGYVHARDRMFQMDLMRRAAAGRLAALFGPAALANDRLMRTLGVRRAVRAEWADLDAPTRAMLIAYARGVNAWIARKGRFAAPEFIALGAPKPWRPTDSLLWGRMMGLWLSGNWRTELARLALLRQHDAAAILALWPADAGGAGRPEAAAVPGGEIGPLRRTARALLAALPAFPAPLTMPASASDEWAVDGAHSTTGAPLLAGDPHLGFGLPGLWYLARIDTPGETLAGATAPGVPFLVLGHNARIAWSFTSTGADVQDVFIETPDGPNDYQTPDGPRPYAIRHSVIRIRGRKPEILTIRSTRHGPVISDLLAGVPAATHGVVLSVAMDNLVHADSAASGLLALNRAGTLAAAGIAAARITSPVQNLLVASPRRIGLFTTGRVPIRRDGAGGGNAGAMPAAGADAAHDWIGQAGGAQLPVVIAPASGRLVNGNERIAPPGFPVFLGRDWPDDWRARRIRVLLDRHGKASLDRFARMQRDTTSLFARAVLPAMLSGLAQASPPRDADAARLRDWTRAMLATWHGEMKAALPQPAIFNAWVEAFRTAALAARGFPADAPAPTDLFVAASLAPTGALSCGARCPALLGGALDRALAGLAARLGPDPDRWRWGAVHQVVFAHPFVRALPMLARIPLLGWMLAPHLAASGDGSTLDRGGIDARLGDVHGPAYRGLYDLADLDRSRFVIVPGQSGNPFSAHARDFLQRWRQGASIRLPAQPAEISARIVLTP